MGKQLNAAEAAVFYTKMRHLFVVDNNRSATAGSRYTSGHAQEGERKVVSHLLIESNPTRTQVLYKHDLTSILSSSTRTRLTMPGHKFNNTPKIAKIHPFYLQFSPPLQYNKL